MAVAFFFAVEMALFLFAAVLVLVEARVFVFVRDIVFLTVVVFAFFTVLAERAGFAFFVALLVAVVVFLTLEAAVFLFTAVAVLRVRVVLVTTLAFAGFLLVGEAAFLAVLLEAVFLLFGAREASNSPTSAWVTREEAEPTDFVLALLFVPLVPFFLIVPVLAFTFFSLELLASFACPNRTLDDGFFPTLVRSAGCFLLCECICELSAIKCPSPFWDC
ncbi:hypothetical protein HAT2_00001 [Candidatus Similichlamydia laticola]|uniref:Uncharacterized protein n=1 Tax=Candidatus Similichlamydia laticola TaxID=2170265 RepID=A0A369KBA3_9BACT|nr:hypothetical protein HAT2_00001 [Candidatus Similichlamydia laticola]